MFKLKDNSRLRVFLDNTGHNQLPNSFPFPILSWEMQTRILTLNLLDHTNPYIVICSAFLEWAIERRAFLICELDQILKQEIEPVGKEKGSSMETNTMGETITNQGLNQDNNMAFTGIFDTEFHTRDTETKRLIYIGKFSFLLSPIFALIINADECGSRTNMLFSYDEAWKLALRYIHQRREHIVDHKNQNIIILKNDLLRLAFRVNSLHISQLGRLIRSQLYHPTLNESDNTLLRRAPLYNRGIIGRRFPAESTEATNPNINKTDFQTNTTYTYQSGYASMDTPRQETESSIGKRNSGTSPRIIRPITYPPLVTQRYNHTEEEKNHTHRQAN